MHIYMYHALGMSSSTNLYGQHHLETLRNQGLSICLFFIIIVFTPNKTFHTFPLNHPPNEILIIQIYDISVYMLYIELCLMHKGASFLLPPAPLPLDDAIISLENV